MIIVVLQHRLILFLTQFLILSQMVIRLDVFLELLLRPALDVLQSLALAHLVAAQLSLLLQDLLDLRPQQPPLDLVTLNLQLL